ncbi:ammonium transporter [Urechidicola vernalis]|uniref:Ammonium transporter n=1 Tax=Urechidicola vernalis TaxID=3075600 RepID=A0ABU2Y377_9FLAO|nr:ammonium transporter [Urechidicola sp. P050]MDT0552104.1 ammonium transporter [Urechidicola sp. P050]
MENIGIDTIWVLIAAALVMLMQAGFSLVEIGLTRAKNSINILMKNFVDFSAGSIIFWFFGFSLMFGEDVAGFIGFGDFMSDSNAIDGIPFKASLIFQTVFAATAATIVSGAIAERTKFSAYLIFSIIITAFIYPISGHWIWGGGWLSEMGFHDFAGSTVVHSVGAWVALAGAIVVGPRIGKYSSTGKSRVIPGHNLAFGALGVFILWFGWFGFNAGSQLAASGEDNAIAISHIFVTTNLSAVAGAMAAMIISWIRYKKPALSITMNGALAGLVGITAGCDIVSPGSALIIGAVAGTFLVLAVEFIDQKLKIDDPVGAVAVHGISGALGTIMVGLFATEGGLFYGGGTALLTTQIIGVVAVFLWAFIMGFLLFKLIKITVGVRVSSSEEQKGLDITEHGEEIYN